MATNEELKSSKILLGEIKEIYYHENDRNQILDNKASIGLTLVGVLLTLCATNLQKYNFKKVNMNNFGDVLFNIIRLLLLLGVFFTLIMSLYRFYKVLTTKKYKHLKTDGFAKVNAMQEENIISLTLTLLYKESIEHNRLVNDKKYKDIDKGINYIVLSVILYVIYMISYKFIL